MSDKIRHRGPDDEGQWSDWAQGVFFSFRRLSILDLSQAGHQPMASHSERYICMFNGEIYNFAELRDRCGNVSWRGHSDTEVLLEHVERFGVAETAAKAAGMFAIAIWDRTERKLYLIRDRIGEKPLYYGWAGSTFLFGSQLDAIRLHPHFQPEVDRNALAAYLKHAYVPAPWSIFQNFYKLLPGTFLELSGGQIPAGFDPQRAPQAYWDLPEVVHQKPGPEDDAQAIDALDQTLRDVVASEMVSDVPLGAFLSGGVDSSLIVGVMQAVSPQPVKTFTIGFREASFNEAEYAKAVAEHLKTDHTEYCVRPEEALSVLPSMPKIYDEPFADPSQIPTFLVARLARQDVTVCLSGDGGDEIFGGYNRYFVSQRIWRKVSRMPVPLRKGLQGLMRAVPPKGYDVVGRALGNRVPLMGDKVHKVAAMIDAKTNDAMYDRLTSLWHDPLSVVKGSTEVRSPQESLMSKNGDLDFTSRMMAVDTQTYLPDDIMVKVDRATMAVSLESRAPFLHHRVVEQAWSLPLSQKVRNGTGKWILRQVLDRYVPRELIERPKMGFAVPIDSWLRGPLREWAEPLLDEKRLEREGYFNPKVIRQKWQEHLSGQRNWQYQLWTILMFQTWLESSPLLH